MIATSIIAKKVSSEDMPKTAPISPDSGEVVDGQAEVTASNDALSDAAFRALAESGAPGGVAWDRGADAFQSGKPITDCPYDTEEAKQDAEDWCGGWVGAERAQE